MIVPAALELIKRSESLKLKAYKCPASVWTIGYGHTDGVKPGQVITRQQAEDLLIKDLNYYEQVVRGMLTREVNPNQLSAMVSLAFNIGTGSPRGNHRGFYWTIVRTLFNKGDFNGAANAFLNHDKARVNGVLQVLPGLHTRRMAERQLFLTAPDQSVAFDMNMIVPLSDFELNPSEDQFKMQIPLGMPMQIDPDSIA